MIYFLPKPNLKHNYFFSYGYKMQMQKPVQMAVLPNLNSTITKIYLGNFEYNLVNKHVEYSDQHMGARQSIFSNKAVKIMKTITIVRFR